MSAAANATRSEYWTGQLEWMRPNSASVKPNAGSCAEPVTGKRITGGPIVSMSFPLLPADRGAGAARRDAAQRVAFENAFSFISSRALDHVDPLVLRRSSHSSHAQHT